VRGGRCSLLEGGRGDMGMGGAEMEMLEVSESGTG
jgi:hypothetical protein